MNCGEFIKEFSDSEYSNDENNASVIKQRRKSDDSSTIRKSKLSCEECDTGKSLSEALIFASDIKNNFCTQHVLPMFCKKKSF